MKIMTILGTRPEIIRLSQIIPKLDDLCEQVLVHTEQNYDGNLNDIFMEQLGVRAPDHCLEARGSFGEQIGTIFAKIEPIMMSEKPDRFLVLGDTNSSLAAIMAKRLGIPVYHMEAGNRCYDDRVPEEVNRRIIDHSSDILMPYTERSRKNLITEGIPGHRIYVTGNPINEVIRKYETDIEESQIHSRLEIDPGRYFLVTVHRQENVDIETRLRGFVQAFENIQREYDLPVIVSTHPRTKNRLETWNIDNKEGRVRFLEPFGFFDFISLEKNAFAVLTDSGTVQEECCIFRVPNVTIRDTTERPETVECGSNILSGGDPESIMMCLQTVLDRPCDWDPPAEYLKQDVSGTVINIMLGHGN